MKENQWKVRNYRKQHRIQNHNAKMIKDIKLKNMNIPETTINPVFKTERHDSMLFYSGRMNF